MKNPHDWLSSHWYPRPGWTESTRHLTWHLVPDDGAELQAGAQEYQRALSGPGVARPLAGGDRRRTGRGTRSGGRR